MAIANFYLKNPSEKGETLIYLIFRYNRNKFKYSFGEKIEPRNWNTANQRAKKSLPGNEEFNNSLDTIEGNIKAIYRTGISNGVIINNDYLKEKINEILKPKNEKKQNFFDFMDEFILVKTALKKDGTIKKYKTLKNHLQEFQKERRVVVSFENIDAKFYEQLITYYIEEKKSLNNTIGKYISTLKTFLHWATERGYNSKMDFVKFKATKEDADIVYLTEKELMKIYEYNLTKNKRLEEVRDTFCFGCFTGLRYSDIAQLEKANIKGDEIFLNTQKTKDKLIIPLNDYALEILKKYNYKLPVITNQKTNDYLKEVGELIKIKDPIILTKYRGAEEVKFSQPKYKFLSTHTARRTFVTLSLEKGMRAETVMSITGHKSYKTFKKYIKLTSKVKLVEMKMIWKKKPKRVSKIKVNKK